jgi:methyl-accepting chemotaxis protein
MAYRTDDTPRRKAWFGQYVAEGDLDVSVAYESKDELGVLSENINGMAGTLKKYISEIFGSLLA